MISCMPAPTAECLHNVSKFCMQGGFFCQAGPMEMFVSQWLLPEHFQYESTTEPLFTSTIAEQPPIRSGCSVRVRIVGYKVQAGKQVSTLLACVSMQASSPCLRIVQVLHAGLCAVCTPERARMGALCTPSLVAWLGKHSAAACIAFGRLYYLQQ